MTILVAEDEPTLREMLVLELTEQGQNVRAAIDGSQAIAMLDQQQPELLLLDLLMPKKDGYAVLKHVKNKGYTFPVIVLSNLSEPQEEQKCRELGAVDFIVKSSMNADELWHKVEKYV